MCIDAEVEAKCYYSFMLLCYLGLGTYLGTNNLFADQDLQIWIVLTVPVLLLLELAIIYYWVRKITLWNFCYQTLIMVLIGTGTGIITGSLWSD
jgi:hypothetical protein